MLKFPFVVPLLLLGIAGCSSNSGVSNDGSGGAVGNGGNTASGGIASSGGSSARGGSAANGGTVGTVGTTSSGGSSTRGGNTASGGALGVGGNTASGGALGVGGNRASGGTASDGGKTGGGGSSGVGAAGNGGARSGGSASIGGTNTGGAMVGGATSKGGTTGAAGGSGGATNPVDATTMAVAMGFGTNIGNTLENTTAWETGWGQPLISQAYINGMASRGIKTVRVPVAWDTYAVNGVIDATKMNRVKEVVGWIEAAGMYSIVNIHWDGGWIYNEANANKYKLTDDVKTKFASYWKQIGIAFSGVGHKLIFEGLNEEANFWVNGDKNQAPDYAALNSLNQLFVTTARAQGGYNATRGLLIAGFTTDIALTCVNAFTVPTDPAGTGKLFLSLHYYTPYTFCGLDTVETWGSPKTTWGTAAEKQELTDLFNKLDAFSKQKKIPVILGEFGVTLGQNYPREAASRTLWMQSVAKACLSRGMVPVLWDTGSEIKRTDGSFSKEFQAVMDSVK